MLTRIFRSCVALALVGCTLLLYATPVSADALGSIWGRVTTAADGNARSGVVVSLMDESASRSYRSAATDERGAFRIDAAVPGRYQLVVEAPEGAFVAAAGLTVQPGDNRPVALSLTAKQQGEAPPPPPPPKPGLATWQKWVIAGGIAVGALLVTDAVTQEESNASPSF
jgi:hypothetical protein